VLESSPAGSFLIEGGRRLEGEVRISGAKNAALPAMAASLLTAEECIIENVPDIEDVWILAEVLRRLGADVERVANNTLRICSRHITSFHASSELVKKMRASFLVVGPLLARFGHGASCPPGGDVIGQRPIDVHLVGFRSLGADVRRVGEVYVTCADRLVGTRIFMDYPSHIGTENLLMAACLAKGTTVIQNASQEPEVVDLARMLKSMGAIIRGAGSSTIEIEGTEVLHGTRHTVIPDRIEAGTFAIAAAATGGDVELRDVIPGHLDSLIWKLGEAGATVEVGGDRIRVTARRPLTSVNVQALPYPGFATDLQAAIGVMLTQASGISVIHERVYDNRLLYVRELNKMGAEIEVNGQTAIISGPRRLTGTCVRALDIRSGAALVLAGLTAEGITKILDIYHLERGYERLDAKLATLGAHLTRVAE
jgi:UDP-N-acetylglucosamine 1-carboxyvinyltransferase